MRTERTEYALYFYMIFISVLVMENGSNQKRRVLPYSQMGVPKVLGAGLIGFIVARVIHLHVSPYGVIENWKPYVFVDTGFGFVGFVLFVFSRSFRKIKVHLHYFGIMLITAALLGGVNDFFMIQRNSIKIDQRELR